jgi:hypothetical protein
MNPIVYAYASLRYNTTTTTNFRFLAKNSNLSTQIQFLSNGIIKGERKEI